MKKYVFLLCTLLCMMSCKPSIDEASNRSEHHCATHQHSRLFYYECSHCGLVVKANQYPDRGANCKGREGNSNYGGHSWHMLCEVGTQRIIQCKHCGLRLQCDNPFGVQWGCCSDGKSNHSWETIY